MQTERIEWWATQLRILAFVAATAQITVWNWVWGLALIAYCAAIVLVFAICKAAGDADRRAENNLTQELRQGTIAPGCRLPPPPLGGAPSARAGNGPGLSHTDEQEGGE